MAAAAAGVIVDYLVDFFVALRRKPAFRRPVAPWSLLAVSVAGSVLKDLDLVPQTYFSNSRNALNVYFVKVSWGWTLLLLTPFVLLANASFSRSAAFLLRRTLSLAVATAVWYVCTEAFLRVEEMSGACLESGAAAAGEFASKAACRRAGFHWSGYDISGHAFILTYSGLLILEETAPMALVKTGAMSPLPRLVLKLLYVALNLLVLLWLWMFVCTSLYFHDLPQKVLGTACGLSGWYLTYRVWYLRPLSPGPPPHLHSKERKQHA